jgi:hypothetical protein
MMKKSLWIVVILLVASQALWAQFYSGLSQAERKELAESYYLVGRQYESQGQGDKGKAFEEMAFNIFPSLDPSRIQMRELPNAAALILEGKAKIAAVPTENPQAIQERLSSRFLRLVSSFLVEDTEGMLRLMDGSVYFTDLGVELTQDQMRRQLNDFFAGVDLRGLVPSQVYNLNSLRAFWTTDKQYLMRRVGERWLLFAVGQKLPPANWVPQRAPAPSGRESALVPAAVPMETLKDNLLAALQDFLKKDVDRAAGYFADEVQIIRLDTTLTRKEIAETFRGYFESADFSKTRPEDIIDPDSIFVQPSDRFQGEFPGPIYLLTVKTRLDLSGTIPFWTRFQDYYFRQESGGWKIFAIF